MSKVIGIDLGTTNSCVAVYDHETTKILSGRMGNSTMPSVVAVTDSGKRLVGHLAKRQAITNPFNTVYGAKRLIGRRWESADVQRAVQMVSYGCNAGPHGDVRIHLAERDYAVPEISSMVLQEMRVVAELALGESIEDAVITVPAYFNDNQRQATKDAGRIAGMNVLRIINEPTAAALAYGFGRGLEEKVAVFDLGGGTFDISVLEIGQGVFEVLSTAGDTFLGGEDFDETIIEWLAESFQQKHDIDLRKDKMALQRLRDAAEKAKIDLSNADASDINLPFIYSGEKGSALHLQERLDRATLESLVKNLVDRTIEISKNTLKTAGLQPKDLSAVLLVGGMSRMPYVQRSVEEFFGLAPSKNVHPDEVVSAGAAIQGYLLSSGGAETLLLDVTPHHLGIMVAGGLFDVIIEKDTTIPTSANKIFTTIRDNQEQVRIIVLQGQSSQADKNELLGEFVLDGLRGAPRGEVKVDVTFSISADGIVSVSARNLESDREQKITVTASSGLSEEEIRQMAEENEESLVAAAASDELEQKRLEVQRILQDIDKLLPKVRPVIGKTDFGVEALARAERSMDKARAAIENNSLDELSACKEPLERTASLLSGVIEKLTS